jgi:hypothetical protein
MLGDDLGLVMLPVKDEGYKECQLLSLSQRLFRRITNERSDAKVAIHQSQHGISKKYSVTHRCEVVVSLDQVDKGRLVLSWNLK